MIKVENLVEETNIYVTGDISDDSWKGWSWQDDVNTYPVDIREMLDESKGKPVNVYINSGGGDLFAGIAISNMLKRHDARTKGIVDGLAGSAASVVLFGCDEIEMPSNAYLMIHKPSCGVYGNSDELLKTAETLEVCQEGILETYMEKANEGISREYINELINNETWLTGEKAREIFNVNVTHGKSNFEGVGNCIMNYVNTPDVFKADKEKAIDIALSIY